MKVKLKTLERIIEDFNLDWKNNCSKSLSIKYNDFHWYLNEEMIEKLGSFIEIEELTNNEYLFYTHYGEGAFWHESWFEFKEEFLKEEDFKV